jgi:predicted NAD/FAD-dependent oxidoreductase
MNVDESAQVIVIGAGVSGLACARELARNGVSCVVLDRARGVGGRCASKTLHGQRVDYGVPYIHGSGTHFLGFVEAILSREAGVTVKSGWPHRVRHSHLACHPESFQASQRRMAIDRGISEFPRAMARDLNVRLGVPIQFLAVVPGGVEAVSTDGRRFRSPRVVLAVAGPQAGRLFEPVAMRTKGGRDLVARLSSRKYLSCLTVVAGYDVRVPAPGWDIAYPLDTTILHCLSHDSGKRTSPDQRVLVYQARPSYSSRYLDAPEKEWTRDMVWEAGEILGSWAAEPAWIHAHAWTWARPSPHDPFRLTPLWVETDGGGMIGFCGDAFSDGGGVEGAFMSGVGLARSMANGPG